MATFKFKPGRLKYINNVDTLECKHDQYLNDFKKKREKKENIKRKIELLTNQINPYTKTNIDFQTKTKIKNNIDRLQKEFDDIDGCVDELEYFSKTHNTIFEYYDIIDKDRTIKKNLDCIKNKNDDDDNNLCSEKNNEIQTNKTSENKLELLNKLSQTNRKIKKVTRKRMNTEKENTKTKPVIDFFTVTNEKNDHNLEICDNINENIIENVKKGNEKGEINRATLFTEYLDLLDFSRSENKIRISGTKICTKCKRDKIIIYSDGIYVCTQCGDVDQILVNSDLSNYKDCLQEKPAYPYKRLNHLNEWLSQFQAKESTDITDLVYEKISDELRKNGLTSKRKITPLKMKDILKKLRLTQYYEHIPHIISRLTGTPPPTISRETEEKLKIMFRDIQAPFAKHKPLERINFLSYSYVLHKFCQLLELDDCIKCFPLLKSRDKLRSQDKLWKEICKDMQWQYFPSI